MPDRHGFNHLPDRGRLELRCIEDGWREGGPAHEWPERRRERHAAAHVRDKEKAAQKKRERAAANALRLANLARRENQVAYGGRP